MKDRVYRFADFELSAAEGELRTSKGNLRLQDKPLLLLLTLLQSPQTLVTRQEIRQRMWDSETFVDYEQGINVAMKKVREALGDSADNPRFIQTVAKKGYRFLLPVEVTELDIVAALPPASQPVASAALLEKAPPPVSHLPARFWIVAVLTAALLIAGVRLFHARAVRARHIPINSIAVLPLHDLSPDPGQEYFADGITEDVITNLAQSLPLRVISHTSVLRYKQTSEPIAQIARELGVQAIVEGAVARSGNRVTVTVQLIDAREDRHLWAQRYDRKLDDLFGLEAELSEEIASQVGGALGIRQRAALAKSPDPQVYDRYLMGRYYWNKRTPAGLHKAMEYFQQAIDRDPNYAPAHAGLADAWLILPAYDSVDRESSFAKAAAEARRALQIDDALPEAHATLAMLALPHWMQQSAVAQQEFHRALQLNPNYATAHHWYAFALIFSGKPDEALAELEKARRLDPLSAIINADEGHLLYAMHRDQEARPYLQQAIELAPDFGQPYETLALIDTAEGHSADAVREASKGLSLAPTNPRTMGEAGFVLAATGHARQARKLLAALQDRIQRGSGDPVDAAFIHIGLGERDPALRILESISAHYGLYGLSQWQPIFDHLQPEPRYQKLIAEMQQP